MQKKPVTVFVKALFPSFTFLEKQLVACGGVKNLLVLLIKPKKDSLFYYFFMKRDWKQALDNFLFGDHLPKFVSQFFTNRMLANFQKKISSFPFIRLFMQHTFNTNEEVHAFEIIIAILNKVVEEIKKKEEKLNASRLIAYLPRPDAVAFYKLLEEVDFGKVFVNALVKVIVLNRSNAAPVYIVTDFIIKELIMRDKHSANKSEHLAVDLRLLRNLIKASLEALFSKKISCNIVIHAHTKLNNNRKTKRTNCIVFCPTSYKGIHPYNNPFVSKPSLVPHQNYHVDKKGFAWRKSHSVFYGTSILVPFCNFHNQHKHVLNVKASSNILRACHYLEKQPHFFDIDKLIMLLNHILLPAFSRFDEACITKNPKVIADFLKKLERIKIGVDLSIEKLTHLYIAIDFNYLVCPPELFKDGSAFVAAKLQKEKLHEFITMCQDVFFLHNNTVYAEYTSDFRGRLYSKSSVNITSSKFARFLLTFKNQKALTIESLMIAIRYSSDKYGCVFVLNDKNTAENLKSNVAILVIALESHCKTLDERLQLDCLCFIFDLKRIVDPVIQVDATASSFQIISIIASDRGLIKICNAFYNETRYDPYIEIVAGLKHDFNRKDLKYILITSVYGASSFTQAQNLISNGSTNFKGFNQLQDAVDEVRKAFASNFPSFSVFRDHLIDSKEQIFFHSDNQTSTTIRYITKKKVQIIYEVSPHLCFDQVFEKKKGLYEDMPYWKQAVVDPKFQKDGDELDNSDDFFSNTFVDNESLSYSFNKDGNATCYVSNFFEGPTTDQKKMKQSVIANYCQMLDSNVMSHVVCEFEKNNEEIQTVHDAFFVNLSNYDLVIRKYNEGLLKVEALCSSHFSEARAKANIKDLTDDEKARVLASKFSLTPL